MPNKPDSSDPTEPGKKLVSRRGFLDGLLWVGGTATVASVIYPISKYLVPPEQTEPNPTTVNVGREEDFKPDTGVIFRMGRKPGLLLRTKGGELRAFTAVCTHLACTVQYRADLGLIWCACHNGRYDLNGINISGPPPRPLTPFKVNVRDGQVFVSREES